ncbi:MAG TPA: hypothetical protein VGD67_04275 [Pseudonocardiaceae bacterium]
MTAAGAAGLGPATPLQRVVHPALVPLYLGNVAVWGRFEPHRTAGFACRFQDVRGRTAGEIEAAYGLDRTPGWPAGGAVHVLRFFTHRTALWATTFGGNTVEGARGGMVYPPPFLGTGYTPGGLPEYAGGLMELPAGTELWRVDQDGDEQRVGRYVHRQLGWIAIGDDGEAAAAGFGPAAWSGGTAALQPTVRRGLVARYRNTDFDADFGPRPDDVTLHPLPGAPAPQDFTERDGTWTKVVKDVELDGLAYLRQRCTWRGARFEVAARNPTGAVLHYLGENAEEAATLGLTQVDLRVWRTVVPAADLTDVQPEITELPPEGQFPG